MLIETMDLDGAMGELTNGVPEQLATVVVFCEGFIDAVDHVNPQPADLHRSMSFLIALRGPNMEHLQERNVKCLERVSSLAQQLALDGGISTKRHRDIAREVLDRASDNESRILEKDRYLHERSETKVQGRTPLDLGLRMGPYAYVPIRRLVNVTP